MGYKQAPRGVMAMTGIVLAVLLSVPVTRAESSLEMTLDANCLDVRAGSAVLLRYRYGDVAFKPYVQELMTPGGVNVLLDAPPDHVHHHALMFACAVNGDDFWSEYARPAGEGMPGKQQHLQFDGVAVTGPEGQRRVRFGESLCWVSQPSEEPLLVEHRTLVAGQVDQPKATVLTWESKLSVPRGKESAVLSGSHYHGLGMRFVRAMDANGEFRNSDNDPGVIFRGEERLSRSKWCACTARADGKVVTAVMFDHPDNARHPAIWFTMAKPFAYLSATMGLHEEPLTVLAGKPLALRYGVALCDGRPGTGEIEALYRQWLVACRKDASGLDRGRR